MNKTLLLFIVIVIEGYVVLATELLTIRQVIPYVGNGTDVVSIIIAAVLMPLAAGYYFGGRFKPYMGRGGMITVRRKLVHNILIAATIMLPGLSYFTIQVFFFTLLMSGVGDRLLMATIYVLVFLVVPVFLLGQTVPLISNYFSRQKLSRITGKMLFCSTMGSFFGAIVSSLILMSYAGVNNTVIAVFILLGALVVLLAKGKKVDGVFVYMAGIVVAAVLLNSNDMMRTLNIVENNAYNTTTIYEDQKGRHFSQNNNDSSMIGPNGAKHPYIEYIEKHYITPTLTENSPPKSILVVGAAGFTVGLEDTKNDYTFVDIDKDIKKVAEKSFLKAKLGPNKHFYGEDIRSFITRKPAKYDLIVLDAFLGNLSMPEQLATFQFLSQMRDSLKEDGFLVANFIASPTFEGRFSQNIDNTMHAVFPHLSRQILSDDFNAWETRDVVAHNLIYAYRQDLHPSMDIYSDNKNRVAIDRPRQNPLAYFMQKMMKEKGKSPQTSH